MLNGSHSVRYAYAAATISGVNFNRMIQAALRYASKGWRVFPVEPGGKRPLVKSWKDVATTDPQTIRDWWTRWPDANIGWEPESNGLCVIDIDKRKPHFDQDRFDALGLPPTLIIQTPNGGEHWYYRGSLPPSVEKLAPGVDTRGRNSYVLLPGSKIGNNSYHVQERRPIASLPGAIASRFATRNRDRIQTPGDGPKTPAVAAGRAFLAACVSRGNVAIAGRGGNNTTFRVAATLVCELGIGREHAIALIKEIWNPHCIPPWSDDELETIVDNAIKYGKHPPLFTIKPEDFAKPQLPPSRFKFLAPSEMMKISEPRWILKDLFHENSLVLLSAAKSSFKTFLAMEMGLSIAANVETFCGKPMKTGGVFYGAHEGIYLIQKRHRIAWCMAHGIAPEADIPFFVGPGPHLHDEKQVQEFGEAIAARKSEPALIILDTYSQCMAGLQENDPADVNRFIYACRSWLNAWPHAAVLILAHLGKDTTRGTRGSSSLEAACDTVLYLNRTLGTTLVSLTVKHQRSAPELARPYYLKGKPVGESLVFEPTNAADARDYKILADPFHPQTIASVLQSVGATTLDSAITSQALANLIVPSGEASEHRGARVLQTLKVLNRRAETVLKALTGSRDGSLVWFAPL